MLENARVIFLNFNENILTVKISTPLKINTKKTDVRNTRSIFSHVFQRI